ATAGRRLRPPEVEEQRPGLDDHREPQLQPVRYAGRTEHIRDVVPGPIHIGFRRDDTTPVGREQLGGDGDSPFTGHWPAEQPSQHREALRRPNAELSGGRPGYVTLPTSAEGRPSAATAGSAAVVVPGDEHHDTVWPPSTTRAWPTTQAATSK